MGNTLDKNGVLDRIKKHYQLKGNADLARFLGVAPNTITNWYGRNSFDIDAIYTKCVDIDFNWLFTGESVEPKISTRPSVGVPYYDVDFIGGFDLIENDQTILPAHNIVFKPYEKATLWCNVTGHSMEQKINHGDIIALQECRLDDVLYGEIYAVVLDTIRTVKILRKSKDHSKLRFVPINTVGYDEQEFDKKRIIKLYAVLGSISKFF
ncbi:LexA family transcriptional regulator [Bacteroides pyogenes]|uniref:Bacteriophage CI repressor protein n=1 Tax=Bacteroides pyogenes F0041 TaxID=1321819 RepID=U2DTS2_9BACE|nr:S24 family peptidase [Bacteroides pyogenes]GAE21196.1 hypothetical protein JCM10003_614 [Bacteroides pyogenes JCM 10003]ERI85032.1 bacteriophage CI repressor protein [Bacteroides pyogenes F0041]MBB3894438.1 hypothetical protein [Bacteroides pyogenes]MBR8726559.1 hypothetical protein [Bacteroides pyogenes]MBR8739939.1 hypothetical protein [Bacteroides pyogenes]